MQRALAAVVLFTACAEVGAPIGKRVDIGGRSLHIVCMGEGPHTVVMESGAAVGFYEWWLVQNALKNRVRTCSYDRAGFGWSDPPSSRSVAGYISDLHELLRLNGEKPPFILVGHSMGGSFVQRYYWRYPSDVAGIIAVDPANLESSQPKLPEYQQAAAAVSSSLGRPTGGPPTIHPTRIRRMTTSGSATCSETRGERCVQQPPASKVATQSETTAVACIVGHY